MFARKAGLNSRLCKTCNANGASTPPASELRGTLDANFYGSPVI
jgi:hypothetical protein